MEEWKRKKSKLQNLENKNEDETAETSGPVENAWSLKIPEFKKGDMKHHLVEESSFSVLFPKYREKYLMEGWPILKKVLDEYGISAELDAIAGRMTVSTTRKTWDPYVLLKARDIIKLLSRSVPIEQALRLLKDDISYEIIKIKNLVRNKERFIKRRQRLIGANGTTLKALELLTDCYVLVQGSTVAAIGPHKGVLQVVRVVLDTMKNIHPVYLLKSLMIKRQLASDPNLKNEDWSRFIPSFKSKNIQINKKKKKNKEKVYTPFPPEAKEQKMDKKIQGGQFFIENEDKKKKKQHDKKAETKTRQKARRDKAFVPPEENIVPLSLSSPSTSYKKK